MKKIVGVVTLYYPNVAEIVRNIQTYLPQLNKLIIWENTPESGSKIDKIFQLIGSEKVEIRGTGKNEGLAKPFNDVVRLAQNEDYDFLLTMDQDSSFQAGGFEKYLKLIENNIDGTVAVYAPNRGNISDLTKSFVEMRTAISSGAVYPVRLFEKTGLFNEDFFVYMVDIEFCLRVKKHNMKTVCVTSVTMLHQEGYAEKSRLGLSVNNYSAQSTYYIIRNTILTWKLYPEFADLTSKVSFYRYKIIYRLLKIVFETHRFRKCKAILLGLYHGFRSRVGRYDII